MQLQAATDHNGIQTVFDQLPGNFLVLLPDIPTFTIVAVTDSYNRVTMTERTHMLGKALFEVFPDNPDDPEATGVVNLGNSLNEVIKSRRPHKMAIQKYDIPYPDGHGFEMRYWRPLNTPVLNERDEILYIIHEVEDVTEKIKTDKALESKTAILERTNEELEQFVRISSHDLQEPLRKIRTFSDMVMESTRGMIDERSIQLLERIEDAAERMSNRLRDLLKYAYLQQEHIITQVDLKDVMKEVLDDLYLLITEKNAEVEMEDLPLINGIRHQLHELFYNLIINALQFSYSEPPPYIRIRINNPVTEPDHKKYVEIIVTDNGIGFEQRHAEKIFTVFERLLKNDPYKGTGIGLSICRKVVNNHGGKIFARGEVGQGASFHVLLPA